MKAQVLKPRDTTARVYQYGVRITRDCLEQFTDQLFRAHTTYNDIVAEIRRVTESARTWLETKAGPETTDIRQKIDILNTQWDEAKKTDNRERLRIIADDRRSLWRRYYELMHAARKAHTQELSKLYLSQLGENTRCTTYRIRSAAVDQGLGWATGTAVLRAALQGYKKQWPKFKLPNFRKIAETPRKTLELQFTTPGGIPTSEILSGIHPEIALSAEHAGRRAYGTFKFRAGSHELKNDITGSVYYHRPLPSEGKVKYARLVEHRIGKDRKHYIQFVVTDIEAQQVLSGDSHPTAALDFGWYYEGDGRRIAGFADNGNPQQAKIFRLPPDIENLLTRSETFKSERDKLRDTIVEKVKEYPFTDVPESIAEKLTVIKQLQPQRVASSRLARLVIDWRNMAPEYETPIYNDLEEWRKKDKLLLQAESHLSSRARNHRRKFYEQLALDLASKYKTIIIDTPELAETAKVKDKTTGKHNKLGGIARSGRFTAALYEFQQALENAAARFSGRIVKIQGRTTKTCSLCAGTMTSEHAADRHLTCTNCGTTIDREANAAAVVWQQGMQKIAEIEDQFVTKTQEFTEQKEKRAARKTARQKARWQKREP